jgi:hypothetical protein
LIVELARANANTPYGQIHTPVALRRSIQPAAIASEIASHRRRPDNPFTNVAEI